ncbi:TCF7L2 [Lepeophtheirus salmonis]|uniref:TCF7L2 n=1 Tax=Lepeophtheirus salmonis TaxID=72036 RepID=A0A7R8CD80_LEPSM|nr:TCF7L2 [Lepeophtheirus salmonis]CAF2776805.1 TCF7L2 [Lepeophtheirus salmonis]
MCLSAMLPSGSNSSSSSTSDETQTSRSVLRPTDTSNSVNSSSSSGRNATASTSSSTSGSGHNEASSPSSLRRGGGSSSNDELGPSDEVKVFKDEGEDERDGGVSESLQAELLEEKSSLISESEMGKSFPPYFPVPGRFFDPNSPFGVPPYLVSPYAAAYANGLANGSALSRSPFLYATDPLSTDQLAAWHHQAASSMYQQANAAAALRSASPYSLPITSGALTSPMSRFSPTSLLPPHPGLSPGAGGLCSPVSGGSNSSGVPSSTNTVIKSERSLESSSNHHHPHHPHHHLNNNNSSSRKIIQIKNSPSKSAAKKSKEPHIKKPLNAFMLYMKENATKGGMALVEKNKPNTMKRPVWNVKNICKCIPIGMPAIIIVSGKRRKAKKR